MTGSARGSNEFRMSNDKLITVTSPYLPPLEEFIPYLERIWESKILTNSGEMHQALEKALCKYLGVEYISIFSNGTLALITALRSLDVKGEVITTPYSFVATAHSLLWNGLKPVFVDIDPETLNIDPVKIEAAITEKTTAILPVHCYGNPCNTGAIQEIARRHNLHVIYDAAHAFGVRDERGSILNHGDLSVLSFHATKVFNTFEGGAVVSPNLECKRRIDRLKNFGFLNELEVVETGINAKMGEVNAAFGLLQLEYIEEALSRRRYIEAAYRLSIDGIQGITVAKNEREGVVGNSSYFPVIVGDDYPVSRDELYGIFKSKGIMVRRYFHPLITDFPMYSGFCSSVESNMPVAKYISDRVLCLPIYPDLSDKDVRRIVDILDFYSL